MPIKKITIECNNCHKKDEIKTWIPNIQLNDKWERNGCPNCGHFYGKVIKI